MFTQVDKVFKPDSFFSKNLNRIIKPNVLCSICKQKFKDFIKSGGAMPKACDACKEKLKDQMFEARYPDR